MQPPPSDNALTQRQIADQVVAGFELTRQFDVDPVFVLICGTAPKVHVPYHGQISPQWALELGLDDALARAEGVPHLDKARYLGAEFRSATWSQFRDFVDKVFEEASRVTNGDGTKNFLKWTRANLLEGVDQRMQDAGLK